MLNLGYRAKEGKIFNWNFRFGIGCNLLGIFDEDLGSADDEVTLELAGN
jgi:hypothetical protein